MYLFHVTVIKYLKSILSDGKLKSASQTGNIEQGSGIYEPSRQKFVFFNVVDKIGKNMIGPVKLYFDYHLLDNRTYYVSTTHSDFPDQVAEWNKGKDYKLKYPQYYKRTKNVLEKLYKNSISRSEDFFYVFQQIAVKNEVNLKYLKCIEFQNITPPKSILQILKNNYPDVDIIYTQYVSKFRTNK